jgi:hypothetical protein
MSIERTERANLFTSLNKPPEHKVTGDHSGSRIAEDANNDGFISLDELRIQNRMKDQVLKGADLNGDGIVSMKETLLNSSVPAEQSLDLSEARKAMEEVSKALVGHTYSSQDKFAQHIAALMASLSLTREKAEELLSQVENEGDVSFLA